MIGLNLSSKDKHAIDELQSIISEMYNVMNEANNTNLFQRKQIQTMIPLSDS